MVKRRHPDGSECKEGIQKVPTKYVPCCSTFHEHTKCCEYDIRYEWWAKSKHWVIVISELAGGGGIEIDFCPHCGIRLS